MTQAPASRPCVTVRSGGIAVGGGGVTVGGGSPPVVRGSSPVGGGGTAVVLYAVERFDDGAPTAGREATGHLAVAVGYRCILLVGIVL